MLSQLLLKLWNRLLDITKLIRGGEVGIKSWGGVENFKDINNRGGWEVIIRYSRVSQWFYYFSTVSILLGLFIVFVFTFVLCSVLLLFYLSFQNIFPMKTGCMVFDINKPTSGIARLWKYAWIELLELQNKTNVDFYFERYCGLKQVSDIKFQKSSLVNF